MTRPTDPDVRLLAALADPVRLDIIRELAGSNEVCACDLTDCCQVSQPTVSHHLKVLREAGAVAEIPPLTLLPIQLATSLGFLVFAGRLRGERGIAGPLRRPVGWLGILNPGLAYALSLLGLALITASLSVLLWAVEPILILLA